MIGDPGYKGHIGMRMKKTNANPQDWWEAAMEAGYARVVRGCACFGGLFLEETMAAFYFAETKSIYV